MSTMASTPAPVYPVPTFKRRYRATPYQVRLLEACFQDDETPDAARREWIATHVDMPVKSVHIWFQNRRAKKNLELRKSGQPIPPRYPSLHNFKRFLALPNTYIFCTAAGSKLIAGGNGTESNPSPAPVAATAATVTSAPAPVSTAAATQSSPASPVVRSHRYAPYSPYQARSCPATAHPSPRALPCDHQAATASPYYQPVPPHHHPTATYHRQTSHSASDSPVSSSHSPLSLSPDSCCTPTEDHSAISPLASPAYSPSLPPFSSLDITSAAIPRSVELLANVALDIAAESTTSHNAKMDVAFLLS
ncbi:hypothetical protein IWQ60_011438 [Tieghemiomyces parasiticus]|uniref:Homeobox domain-containing protein n=1 Tax=Tieghemiomyces parasiticus TaxID=78921 RepID=A0A9W8DIG1_9FUNG|nr:hypothetical protein IWQ60_011438 [Tieghemiomyces parasiticus]